MMMMMMMMMMKRLKERTVEQLSPIKSGAQMRKYSVSEILSNNSE